MKFILYFFLYGLLFFAINHFFPEAFATLVSWANTTFEFVRQLVLEVADKVQKPTAS